MAGGFSDAKDSGESRATGARGDFLASLPRKVEGARDLVAALEDDPSARPAREELRRRLHALAAGARLLRFDAMSAALADALAALDRGAQAGGLRERDVSLVSQTLEDLPALAWGERVVPSTRSAPAPSGADPGGTLPAAALVVGDEGLAEALEEATGRPRTYEVERTSDARGALEVARAYAPDVVIVDADVPGAPELVEALLDDPLTEPVPIIVVGSFRGGEEAARFVALGVTRALPRPVPQGALARVCDEALDVREERTLRLTLGEPTLEQLADTLASELRRALVDSVDGTARSCRVPLGEGTEVLGALWGAIARVQEIVAHRTGGAIRFAGGAPEGAVAIAPWLPHEVAAADRAAGRERSAGADVPLRGRRVVVVDDDPGVTWFLADLLRTAGCEVHEALDGAQGLATALRVSPQLVVSDILMPGLDGFALCRALRRDVALRDTPVILLSWKEDLLQRVRELGASAAAYMRKESDARAVLARVAEVLRPRARLESRLRGDGEVRGRLDGITTRMLLELVGSIRRNARVGVRDASYMFEVEIRGGSPRAATRTSPDGTLLRGDRALASLLGVGAARFVVASSADPVRAELQGSLTELLAAPLAAARGALAATTGAGMMRVERIRLADEALGEYLRVTPDPARALVQRLGAGESPRQMLLGGEVAPSLYEDVVADLSARGLIVGVEGAGRVDLMGPAVEGAAAVLRGAPLPRRSEAPSAPPPSRVSLDPGAPVAESVPPRASPSYEELSASVPPPRPSASGEPEPMPSSLEDAVMRELSDRSPDAGVARPISDPPTIIEPGELRPRSSNPPATEIEPAQLPSLPPDAVVPAAPAAEEALGVAILSQAETPGPVATPEAEPTPTIVDPVALSAHEDAPVAHLGAEAPAAPQQPRAVHEEISPTSPGIAGVVIAATALLAAVGFAIVAMREPRATTPRAAVPSASATQQVAPAPPSASGPPPVSAERADDDVPAGAGVPQGFGLVEIHGPPGARLRVDGAIAGAGPSASLPVAPGVHDVRVEKDGRETRHAVEVRAGKISRVESSLTP